MTRSLISLGLECFAKGDFSGAAQCWLSAKTEAPDDPQLTRYLEHLRSVAPELVAALDAGAGTDTRTGAAGDSPSPAVSPAPPAARAGIAIDADPWISAGSEAAPIEVRSAGPGLDLVNTAPVTPVPARPPTLAPLLARLRELMSLDGFSIALDVAAEILRYDPQNAEARRARAHARSKLEGMYTAKLGDVRAVPSMRMPPGEVIWLDLDHRAGFVLAQVDGISSFEEIIEVTGMDRLEAMRILCDLLQKGVIGVEEP